MSKFLKSNSAKVVLGLVAFALAFASNAQAYTFTAPTLKLGSKGVQVMELQKALNMCADTMVSSVGAGSPGMETSVFAGKTKAAVKVWQAKMGLSADGLFGPASRNAMNTNGCGTPSTGGLPAGCTSTSGFSPITGQACSGGTTTPQTGPVSASLSTNNPAAGTLVAGQATADLAHFTFTGTGTVTNVTLQRIGVSSDSTPSNVYLFDGAARLTDAASVSNNGMVTFNVPAGLFTVNGSKIISVKSDIALSTSGQTVGMRLVSFATAAGTTTANISGNVHQIASATLASVALSGTVTPSGATINPGAAVTLWQGTLTISQRDVWMKRLALRNVGSAPSTAFQNFKLYVNGVQVGTAAGMDSMGYVTFDLSSAPVSLVAGSRVVRVDADVVSGASRTVQLSLRQAADVDFVDSSFGVNITPSSTPWAPTSASTIAGTNGGSLTIEKDVTSPSGNIILNGSDIKLATYKLTAYGEPIKIESLKVGGTASSADAAITLRNARLLINGVQYGSSTSLPVNGTGASFTTNYTVMPGTPVMVEVRADAYDNDGTGALIATDSLLIKILAGSSNATRVDSLGSFNSPASDVSANTVTLASASLSLAKNGTYANQSVALPQTNYKIGSWNLSGSSVEDVLLTTLSFDVDEVSSTTFNEDDITNLYVVVKNNGAIVAQTSPVSTTSAADNNFSINYTLAKNSNLVIELYGNLGSTVTGTNSFKTDLTVSGTSMTSGNSVTATSADTDGQTIAQGTASIAATLDASTPVSGIVFDNQTVETADFKFAATTSGYTITEINFTQPAGAATVVDNMMLYDGATLIASKSGSSTSVSFTGLNWNVPANTNKVLTVKLQLATVGPFAGSAGADLTTTLTSFKALSNASGVEADGTESNPAGNAMYAYAAIPMITEQSIAGTLTNVSNKPLIKFKVDAMGGSIGWNQFYFDVSKDTGTLIASGTASGISLWDVTNGGNTQVAGTFTNSSGLFTGSSATGTISFVPTVEQQIATSKTYELRGTISGANADGDFVTVTLANDSNVKVDSATAASILSGDTDAPVIWSDLSASNHSTATSDWTSDFGIKNLPVSGSLNW